jgi:hypothetical protein
VIGPPPRPVRRLIVAPVVFAIGLVLLALSPVALVLAAIFDVVVRRNCVALRLTGFAFVYVLLEVVSIPALCVLWIASGFGLWMRSQRMQAAHYAFMRWFIRSIYRAAGVLLRLRIEMTEAPDPRPGPVLVFGRHAGPGNSLMLVGALLLGYRRRPRVVMLAELQWDPVFDMLGNRLPNRFIDHDPAHCNACIRGISQLALGLGDADALVIYPEGHDFTRTLRARGMAHWRL